MESTLRHEAREWFALALPLAFTILCRTGMMLTDISVLGLWDSEYLGAAGVSSVFVSLSSVIIWRGFLEAINTLCGQAYGAKNYQLVGEWLGVGLTLSTALGFIIGVSWIQAGDILRPLAGYDSIEANRVNIFCRISLLGLFPFNFYAGISNFLSTIHIIMPLLYINLFSLVINLGLNVVLVSGIPGWFEGLGFPGSPLATSITRITVFIMTMIWIIRYVKKNPESELAKCWPTSLSSLFCASSVSKSGKLTTTSLYREFSSIALPIAFSSFLEEAQIQVVGLMAARLGDKEMATHNAILQVFFVSSSFLISVAVATQVRMSKHLGAGDFPLAKVTMKIGIYAALICGGSVAIGFIILRDDLAYLYSKDEEVHHLTGQISTLVGLGYLGLAAFYVSVSVLSAQARPQFIALAFFIGAWGVGVPSAYLFAFQIDKTKGLIGLWLGLTCGYIVVTIISVIAVYKSDWEQITKDAVTRSSRERRLSEPLISSEDHLITIDQ